MARKKYEIVTIKKSERKVKHPVLLKMGKTGFKAGKFLAVNGAKAAAKAKVKAKEETVRKIIKEAPESTGFNNSTENNPSGKSSELLAAGYNKASEFAVKSPKRFVKTVKKTARTIKKTKKNIDKVKNAAAEAKTAAQEYKKMKEIKSIVMQGEKQAAKQTTKETAKGTAKLAWRIGKAAATIVKNTLQALANFLKSLGWIGAVIAAVVVLVCSVIFILSSAFGIFIPDDSSTMTMSEAVAKVNKEYQDKVNQLINDYDNNDIDLIQYSGTRAQWKYVIALYAVKYSNEDGNVVTIDDNMVPKLSKVFFDMHTITASYTTKDSGYGTVWKVLTITTTAKTMAEMMDLYQFDKYERSQVADILASETDDMWSKILYGLDGANGGYALVEVAREQLNNMSGQMYWTWYGYDDDSAPDEWSGCFVSWCANEVGYIAQGVFPQFSNIMTGAQWFKDKGMWLEPNSSPNVGDIIFLDYNNDGIADRCGIVSGFEDNKVKGIVGGPDYVKETKWELDNRYGWILGYGMLAQISGLNGDTVEEQCYNYLRAEGYSDISACAVLANFQGECSCDPARYSRDYGDAAGIMQWTGVNKNIFFSWCDNNAMDWRNLESQLNFYSYWLNDVNNGEWGRVSVGRHPDFKHRYSTDDFKSLSADDYDGDIARALYEATAMFVDDMERPAETWDAETRRYTYSVQFYNYLTGSDVDGTTQSAWRPEYANDIGVFHLN